MKKILVIHGPNINLLGKQSAKNNTYFTLDKINKYLREQIKNTPYSLKIIQSHNESKINSFLHKNYKKSNGLLLSPGIWDLCGFIIKNTIDIIEIPYVVVKFNSKKNNLFDKNKIIFNQCPKEAYISGINHLLKII